MLGNYSVVENATQITNFSNNFMAHDQFVRFMREFINDAGWESILGYPGTFVGVDSQGLYYVANGNGGDGLHYYNFTQGRITTIINAESNLQALLV